MCIAYNFRSLVPGRAIKLDLPWFMPGRRSGERRHFAGGSLHFADGWRASGQRFDQRDCFRGSAQDEGLNTKVEQRCLVPDMPFFCGKNAPPHPTTWHNFSRDVGQRIEPGPYLPENQHDDGKSTT